MWWLPKSVTDGWWWKALLSTLVYLFGGDAVVHAMYVPFCVLMVIDLGTGIWASQKQGIPVSSQGLARRTLRKFAAYATIVVSARMLERLVALSFDTPDLWFVSVKVALLYLATAEATSIDENLRRAAGIGLGAVLLSFIKATGRQDHTAEKAEKPVPIEPPPG